MAKKQKSFAGGQKTKKKFGAVIDDPVRACLLKFGVASGSRKRQDVRSRRFAGANSRRSILDDNALARRYAEELRTFQVWLGVRLASPHIAGPDQMLGLPQSRRANAHAGQRPRAGGDDGPALQRERLK